MASDQVTLTVPARDEFARAVRMTAVALLGRSGVSIDLLDDIRIAVEEAFIHACEVGGCEDNLTFVFTLQESSFDLRIGPLVASRESDSGQDASDRYSRFILESVCDEFETECVETGTYIRIRKLLDEV